MTPNYTFVPDIFKQMTIKRKKGLVKESNICPVCGYEVDIKKDCCFDGLCPALTLFVNNGWCNSICHKKCYYILVKGSSEIINQYSEDYMLEAL